MKPLTALFFFFLLFLSPALAFSEPLVLITDPQILLNLEQNGHNFSSHLSFPKFQSVVQILTEDLRDMAAKDRALGVGISRSHRLFDAAWLSSPETQFELVGVSNRLDRQPFEPKHCGEVRFIYRLSYQKSVKGKILSSRLPMTINLVYWAKRQEKNDCSNLAKRWRVPSDLHLEGKSLAAFLISSSGPLSPELISWNDLKSLEVNLQSVRWPSTIRPDMGAHAEYLLRVFHFDPTKKAFSPAPLENTPDVDRLRKDPRLRQALLNWIRLPENLKKIDEGIAVLPEKFLSRKAISISPQGLGRLANRPYDRLFKKKDFEGIDWRERRYVRSAAELLRRLNDSSCMGCHQARSVAGFHFLGEDRNVMPNNGIAVFGSPHLLRDLPRRKLYVETLAQSREPSPSRPLSEHADEGEGDWGSHCGLGSAFMSWTCQPGLECRSMDVEMDSPPIVGQCFHPWPPKTGEPCESGKIQPDADPRRDRMRDRLQVPCERGVCEAVEVGFPNGMCSNSCSVFSAGDRVTCGGIAILQDFNTCLSHKQPFDECLSKNIRPATLRACDIDHPCRDDYICAEMDADLRKEQGKGNGACVPPYFLFQLRVDGHP